MRQLVLARSASYRLFTYLLFGLSVLWDSLPRKIFKGQQVIATVSPNPGSCDFSILCISHFRVAVRHKAEPLLGGTIQS